ncbi:HEPN domain-containing protein [Burkholderia gladioli]|uniref:HEPN domain-containing protein n=1 Tax=Burkholderia gladioli TaxID=28095 RepID=UPI0016411705|nr:HEPN domain-containing protein [Burkholderia gladioli]
MAMRNIYPKAKFTGALVDQRGKSLNVEFYAAIDQAADLHIQIEPVPENAVTFEFVAHNFGRHRTLHQRLIGTNVSDEFSTSDFYLTGRSASGKPGATVLSLVGECESATIISRRDGSFVRPAAICLYTNGFKTFTELQAETDNATIQMYGHQLWDKHESPTPGVLTIVDKTGEPSITWFEDSRTTLQHVARVMSLGLDVYISPRLLLEQRSNEDIINVYGTTSSPPSYIPPFKHSELGNLFKHACSMSAVERQEFEMFDLPIRWLTAPVQYDEARHIGAMTALEAILSATTLPGVAMLERSSFNALRKKLATVICENVTDSNLAKLMCKKLPDLNRASLRDKLKDYLQYYEVPIDDFDPDVLDSVIAARNQVVHTGIGKEKHADIGPYMFVARALVTRMILRGAKYRGKVRWTDGATFRYVDL